MISVKELEMKIKEYSQNYYDGHPIVTDVEFDALVDKLRFDDPNNDLLNTIGWGSEEYGKKSPHSTFIGSLGKTKDVAEIKWDKYITFPKLDGMSIVAYYEDGKLEKITTRGNGTEGRIVTSKLKHAFPATIQDKSILSVRGEAIIKKVVFEEKWKNSTKLDREYKHPRNFVAGIINNKENLTQVLQDIHVLAYKIVTVRDENVRYFKRDRLLKTLRLNKFNALLPLDIDISTINPQDKEKILGSLDYQCDGLVISNNDAHISELNNIDKEIIYEEIAYKFEDPEYKTVITDINWSRSGRKFIPVAKVEPVEIAGGTISNILLDNYKNIIDNKIGVGSEVMIIRANEIIPRVTQVVSTSVTTNAPAVCSSCQNKLKTDVYGTHLICDNEDCPANIKDQISRFILLVNNDESPIGDGLINIIISSFVGSKDWDKVLLSKYLSLKSFISIIQHFDLNFFLTPYKSMDGVGDSKLKIIENLFNKIKGSVKFEHYLMSRFENIGQSWANHFSEKGVEFWDYNSTIKDYSYKGLPQRIKMTLNDHHEELINLIENNKVKFKEPATSLPEVAITGSMSVPRKKFEEIIKEKRFVLKSINKKTKYLICNEKSSSSKYKFAIDNNISILTEKEFIEI